MSNTDQDLKDTIADLLRDRGFEVVQLPERDERTPDLLVTYQHERYIIEIKSKRDNEALLREESEFLANGEIVKHFEGVGRRVPVARVIESAIKQIRNLPPRASDFRLIWLHAEGFHPQLQMQQFHGTLYGTTDIIDLEGPTRLCYYFYHNELHRFRAELDGAILTDGEKGQLCLNNFSPRAVNLRESFLAREAFKDGICDPEVLERNHGVLIADGTEDRQDSDAVLRFLQKKYGRMMIMKMDMAYYEFRTTLPIDGSVE
ncbi:MAG TPA: hypothetical protein VF173_37960 [Thermoanaerobaculia bacterium]|nr:hypothetical protein [Thermoanaerobaculia bacterium]